MEYVVKHKTLYDTLSKQKNIFVDISMMLVAVVFLAILVGVFPFLIGDATKIGVAVALFPYIWKGSERLST